MDKLVKQIIKFGIVGAIATVIDFTVLAFLTEFFFWDPVAAAAVSFIVSLVFNYCASMRYVFKHREDISRKKEFVLFVLLSAIGLGLNELIMALGVHALHTNYLVVKVVSTGFVMIWNFISRKMWLEAPES